jgi:hypothetical protein
MWHRVAALLSCTVPEARERISSAEFVDWCAFYSLEPWGYEADTWRMAVIASTSANYSGRVKKPLKPSDFIPSPRKTRRQTPDEMLNVAKKMVQNDG